jgi:hypothetical protein
MKRKLGILLCVLGIFALAVTGIKFIVQRENDTETVDSSKGQIVAFPWITTTGAVLIASGIIMIATKRRRV